MEDIDSQLLLQKLKEQEHRLSLLDNFATYAFWHNLDLIYSNLDENRNVQCIVCDYQNKHSSFSLLTDHCQFGGGKLTRYICPKCDCVFGLLKYLDLPNSLVSADYALLYSKYSESNSIEAELESFYALNPIQQKLYLNWGCGGSWTNSISYLREQGFDVWGYEPSISRSEDFIVKHKGEISAKFDAIFSNNVIEHFRHPVHEFLYFKSILAEGGQMAHQSPCYELKYTDTRFHTLFLLGRSPHILAERTGFTAHKCSSVNDTTLYIYKQ
jgi:hypothetical protein